MPALPHASDSISRLPAPPKSPDRAPEPDPRGSRDLFRGKTRVRDPSNKYCPSSVPPGCPKENAREVVRLFCLVRRQKWANRWDVWASDLGVPYVGGTLAQGQEAHYVPPDCSSFGGFQSCLGHTNRQLCMGGRAHCDTVEMDIAKIQNGAPRFSLRFGGYATALLRLPSPVLTRSLTSRSMAKKASLCHRHHCRGVQDLRQRD
ncbi:hypothetical protein C8Q73DRAFT_232696 [Cubamyces lactineus]|nr:hypothetical protein C8Q73DRAFT_232696 [Cubamyces lactineus]